MGLHVFPHWGNTVVFVMMTSVACHHPEVEHTTLEGTLVHAAVNEFEKSETIVAACFFTSIPFGLVISIPVESVGEGDNAEVDTSLFAEIDLVHNLLHGRHENLTHRSRPVQEEHDAVRLTIGDFGLGQEDIVIELV